eukprot:GHVT01042809.1.p1 GENE.GHVT01042809.1~~GHVT01042809.1.p1  ORF type:complete len:370 (-),score=75.89 GHVT01042809.1:214-1260(-)
MVPPVESSRPLVGALSLFAAPLKQDEIDQISDLFKLVAGGDGKLELKDVKNEMASQGFEVRSSMAFVALSALNKENKESLSLDDFLSLFEPSHPTLPPSSSARASTSGASSSATSSATASTSSCLSPSSSASSSSSSPTFSSSPSPSNRPRPTAVRGGSVEVEHPLSGDASTALALREVFKLFDDDNTGMISFRNIQKVAKDVGARLSATEIREILQRAGSAYVPNTPRLDDKDNYDQQQLPSHRTPASDGTNHSSDLTTSSSARNSGTNSNNEVSTNQAPAVFATPSKSHGEEATSNGKQFNLRPSTRNRDHNSADGKTPQLSFQDFLNILTGVKTGTTTAADTVAH